MKRIVIVGGGAAGMAAAIAAAEQKPRAEVRVLERLSAPGKKLLATGNGRCNLTNLRASPAQYQTSSPETLAQILAGMTPEGVLAFFRGLGLWCAEEDEGRVYPRSRQAASVLAVLQLAMERRGVLVECERAVTGLFRNGAEFSLRCADGSEYRADAVLVATGGVSYPTTGSTGDGYKLAQQAGHTLVEPVPSLVSLVSHDADCKKMMGLALKNVTLTLFEDDKAIFDEQGEMLFTHFGISGPLTLSASSHLGDMKKHRYIAEIDLKPALSEEQLYDRITRDFALLANHAAQGALVKLLPSSMQPVMVARWGIDPATKANQITREQKRELVQLMKHWRVSIDARGDLAHAVITSGGVSVREVDPKTMQSKKALGLYFAGEVLDVDAYTGGYNLQIAFCTAQSFANNL